MRSLHLKVVPVRVIRTHQNLIYCSVWTLLLLIPAANNAQELHMSFQSLGLKAEILRAVESAGYSTPTPIQAKAIPLVIDGKDLMAGAQTGTGKTAGFTLPILHRLSQNKVKGRPIRALVLVPTRELAAQVHENVQTYSQFLEIKSTVVFGGVNIRPQISQLKSGVDVLIATPGRLLDHVNQGNDKHKDIDLNCLDVNEAITITK